jgi:hypothetical protein
VGNSIGVERVNPESDDSLRPAEALDADEVRNDDGDQGATVGDAGPRPDDDIDHIEPDDHGIHRRGIDDTPEDGDSIFPVVE